MADVNGLTTDRLPGDTSPDNYRVLLRDRIRIETTDYTLSGSWYRATATVDLGQYQFAVLPMVEAYVTDGTLKKMPCSQTSSSGALIANYYWDYEVGAKTSGLSTKINFFVGNTSGGQLDIYYQVMSLPGAGSLFP